MDLTSLIDERRRVAEELRLANTITGLLDSGGMKAYLDCLKHKYKSIAYEYDAADPSDAILIAGIKARRHVYLHEIKLLEESNLRARKLDSQLKVIDKEISRLNKKGNDGSNNVPPKLEGE